MRVEFLLPAVALSIAASACGSGDSGNVMAANANALEPAVIDAALGPGSAGERDLNATNNEFAPATNSPDAANPDVAVATEPESAGESTAANEAANEAAAVQMTEEE